MVASSRKIPGRVRRSSRRGFTLVEMLVTVAVTLILVFSMVQMFQWIGERVADGRGAIELGGGMRGVAARLQLDLDGVTVPVRPWPDLDNGAGYFEIIEGSQYDGQTAPADTITGDLDDALMFTAYAVGEPFVGQVLGQIINVGGRPTLISDPSNPLYVPSGPTYTTITSKVAEIIWWTRYDDANGNNVRDAGEVQTLHRRVLLIRPDIDTTVDTVVTARPPVEFFNSFDLSARRNTATGVWTTNSLADLTARQNRFAHNSVTFPHLHLPGAMFAKTDLTWSSAPARQSFQLGEDVMASFVLSFDVRVFDPGAQILSFNGETVRPGDPGWTTAKNQNPAAGVLLGTGDYVDLNYSRMLNATGRAALPATDFSGSPTLKSQLNATQTYDTWSWSYEHDGVNQDADAVTDEAVDGLDNDANNGVDDLGERETAPPYPVPLRGVQVSIRLLEPDTRQVRQREVTAKFIPE